MSKYQIIFDSQGRQQYLTTALAGADILNHPKLNKGTAFSAIERQDFHLAGKLPERIESLNEQVSRMYAQYQEQDSDLAKNVYLNNLHDTNEILFYKLISEHLTEMLPIIYTPTVGTAVENYSLELRRSRGIFLSYEQRGKLAQIIKNRNNHEVDLVLVTDGEGVLGIGDQGIGGMDIAIAKLMVYTLCGGINPNRVLPIQLDVGTNNEKLLNDPLYLGRRKPRVIGTDYDNFIDEFVTAVRAELPHAYLHWEDFGRNNARRNLNRFRHKLATFNDDMQGTGATALACVLAGVKASKASLTDQRIVVLGAGTAGVGIVDQICDAMVKAGLPLDQARQCFWLVDRDGLIQDNTPSLIDFQQPYARPHHEINSWSVSNANNISLLDVVKNTKPTILIGCSTAHGAFNEAVVKTMAAHVERPIILPLSNPTEKSEAEPSDLITWTHGKALVATGSPFQPVNWQGQTIPIAQSNNAYVFPGLGLGVIAARAQEVTDGMIHCAADTLSDHAPAMTDQSAPLLPDLNNISQVSQAIALAVAQQARREGVAKIGDTVDLQQIIKQIYWQPQYLTYRYLVDDMTNQHSTHL